MSTIYAELLRADSDFIHCRNIVMLSIVNMLQKMCGDMLNEAERTLIAQIATDDFLTFLGVEWGLYGRDFIYEFRERFCDEIYLNTERIVKMLEEWLPLWLSKWNQRVILIGEKSSAKHMLKAPENIEKLVTQVYKLGGSVIERLKDALVYVAVENLEVCMPQVIVDGVVRSLIHEISVRQGINDPEKIIQYIEDNYEKVLREGSAKVREIAKSTMPLIQVTIREHFLNMAGGGE